MKYITLFVSFCLLPLLSFSQKQKIVGQPCDNAGFESGSLSNWDCYTGYYGNGRQSYQANPQNFYPLRHEVVSGPNVDAHCGIPKVNPNGGSFSCKLGNDQTGQAEVIEQIFQVSANNRFFNYKFAVVLNDVGEPAGQEPYFKAIILDANNSIIPCGSLSFKRNNPVAGMQTYNVGVYWNWQSNTVDLSAYVGQNVTVRFETADCATGSHYGYAYIDGDCLSGSTGILISDSLCSGESVTLTSVANSNYLWNTGATTQSITVNSPGLYWNQGNNLAGCPMGRYYRYVTQSPDPTASFSYALPCSGVAIFTNTSTVSNPAVINLWDWDFGDGVGSNLQNPVHTYLAPGTYTVRLSVQTNLGCRDTVVLNNVQIKAKPLAAFTNTTECAGQVVQFINGSTIAADSIVQYDWDFGDGSPHNGVTNPSHVYTNPGIYPVTMICISDNGCSDTAYAQLVVNYTPVAAFVHSPACLGNLINFTDNSNIGGGDTLTTWTWNFGDGGPLSHSQSPSHVYFTTGNYTVTLIVGSVHGCVDTLSVLVPVYANPVAQFSSSLVCGGIATLFTDLSVSQPGNSIINWSWNFGDGTPYGTNQNENHIYSNSGSYPVTLTVTTANGCSNSSTKNVVVYPSPIMNFSVNGNCESELVYYTDNSSNNGAVITQRDWDFGDGTPHGSLTNETHVYALAGTYLVTLTLNTNKGCTSILSQTISILPKPVASFSGVLTVCANTAASFMDQSQQLNGTIANRSWNFGDGSPLDTNQNPSHIFTQPGNYTILLTVTGSSGCTDNFQQSVSILDAPIVSYTSSEGCEGQTIQFTDNTLIGGGVQLTAYDWDFGDGGPHSNVQNPSHLYGAFGVYTVGLIVIAANGCVGNYTQPLTIHSSPVSNFSFNGLCMGVVTSFHDMSNVANGFINIREWDYGDGTPHSFNPNPYHLYSAVGNYTVIFKTTSNEGCEDTLSKMVSITECVGIEESGSETGVSLKYVYNDKKLFLAIENTGSPIKGELILVNTLGQSVKTEMIAVPTGGSILQIPTGELSVGIYIARTVISGKQYSFRFVKE